MTISTRVTNIFGIETLPLSASLKQSQKMDFGSPCGVHFEDSESNPTWRTCNTLSNSHPSPVHLSFLVSMEMGIFTKSQLHGRHLTVNEAVYHLVGLTV